MYSTPILTEHAAYFNFHIMFPVHSTTCYWMHFVCLCFKRFCEQTWCVHVFNYSFICSYWESRPIFRKTRAHKYECEYSYHNSTSNRFMQIQHIWSGHPIGSLRFLYAWCTREEGERSMTSRQACMWAIVRSMTLCVCSSNSTSDIGHPHRFAQFKGVSAPSEVNPSIPIGWEAQKCSDKLASQCLFRIRTL